MNVARKVQYRYVFAIILVVAFTGISQYLIHTALNDSFYDADWINLSGRQRMLSQKLAKSYLLLKSRSLGDEDQKSLLLEVKKDIENWTQTHGNLGELQRKENRFHSTNPELPEIWSRVTHAFSAYAGFLEDNLQHEIGNLKPAEIQTLMGLESSFLQAIDEYVFRLALASRGYVERVGKIEYFAAVSVILIVFFELFFIFLPGLQELRRLSIAQSLSLVRDNETKSIDHLNFLRLKLAHDVLTPISAARIELENALADLGRSRPSPAAEAIQMSRDSLQRAMDIVAEINNVGSPLKLHWAPVDLSAVIADVIKNIQLTRNLKYKISILEMDPVVVDGREIDFYQVTQNLLINAIESVERACEGGSLFDKTNAAPAVAIELIEKPEAFELAIHDRGQGFQGLDPKEAMKPFVSTKVSVRENQVYGLGLSIVSEIVKNYPGSEFEIRNSPEGGAVARWTLFKASQG